MNWRSRWCSLEDVGVFSSSGLGAVFGVISGLCWDDGSRWLVGGVLAVAEGSKLLEFVAVFSFVVASNFCFGPFLLYSGGPRLCRLLIVIESLSL
ncbi:hypothetical protein ACFX19_006253 [Malus domestica]